MKYNHYTKTAFLINVNYYGWVKSINLAVPGDVLDYEHRIHSFRGETTDIGGVGVFIIVPKSTGKTAHYLGLMRLHNTRIVSDDWYYVRLSTRKHLELGSEKNIRIQAGIGKIWNEYESIVDKARFDSLGRAVVNVRWIVDSGGVISLSTLQKIILLKRDQNGPTHCNPINLR